MQPATHPSRARKLESAGQQRLSGSHTQNGFRGMSGEQTGVSAQTSEAREGETLSARGHPTGPHLFPDGQLQALSLDPRPRTPEVLMKALLVSRCVRHEVLLGTQEQHRFLPYTEDDTLLLREAIAPVLHGYQSPVQPLGLCPYSSSLIRGGALVQSLQQESIQFITKVLSNCHLPANSPQTAGTHSPLRATVSSVSQASSASF